jgi:hypothetical protein
MTKEELSHLAWLVASVINAKTSATGRPIVMSMLFVIVAILSLHARQFSP